MIKQQIIPAISNHKDLEIYLKSKYDYCVIMSFHINHLDDVIAKIHNVGKKVIVHIDLINGLCNDKYGAEYLCQKLKVDGIISTKSNVLLTAKANKCLAIQRIFLIDSTSLSRSIDLVNKIEPDYLEVLPAIASGIISEIIHSVGMPIIGGGLITTQAEIDICLKVGLFAITSSKKELW